MTSLTSTARGPASGRRHGRSRAAVEYQRTTVGASSVGSASLIVLAQLGIRLTSAGRSACLRLAGRRRLKPPLGPSISEAGLRRRPVRSVRVRARPELERRWPGRSLRAGHRGDPGLGRRRSRGTSAAATRGSGVGAWVRRRRRHGGRNRCRRPGAAAGAVDVLVRPRCDDGGSPAEFVQELRQRLRVASRVRVIRHPRGRLRGASADDGRVDVRRRAASFGQVGQPGLFQVVVIGASTGGPAALATVLRGLPPGCPAAAVVVQHMSAAFVDGLAHWLNGTCALPVEVAVDGGQLLPATVLIAPGGGNLIVNSNLTTRCQPPAVGQFHVPGIDHTLTSLAGSRGERVVGVLLTGMGRDGAAGLLALRQRGAVTIGQDEATSAVYGMPAAALALGAISARGSWY